MALPKYRYEPLTNETSFRLFRILKAQPHPSAGNQIQIHLFEADFNDAPTFEAISYAWGTDGPTSTILCDDRALSVTPNVEAILRFLARQKPYGAFWVDSICINQTSVAEKNVQVPRMRSIYHQADLVWVWLGDGTYQTVSAINFLAEIAAILDQARYQEEYRVSPLNAQIIEPHARFRDKVRSSRGFYDAVDTNFIVDLLNLPWFHRTWTVQELVLARDAVFVCGPTQMRYADLIEVLQMLQDHELAEASRTSRSNPASYYDEMQCYLELTSFLRSPRHRKNISHILRMMRPKSSSKPEDKVYGLYGIFSHMRVQNIPPVNYDRPVQATFTQITTAAIKSEHNLDVLYDTCLPQTIRDLPSWVPDWSNSAYHRPISLFEMDATGSDTAAPTPYEIQGNQLSVRGQIVDEIREVATSTSIAMASFRRGYDARLNVHETNQRRTGVLELVRTLQVWIRLSRKIQGYPTGTTPLEAFRHTIMQNGALFPRIHDDDVKVAFEQFMHVITVNFPDSTTALQTLHNEIRQLPEYLATVADYAHVFEKDMNVETWPEELQIRLMLRLYTPGVAAVQHDISLNTYHKTFLISRDGYMGTCPRWAKAGDLIALISGLRLPFIARREEEHYRLVGPAYVHGVMQGERWSSEGLEAITLV